MKYRFKNSVVVIVFCSWAVLFYLPVSAQQAQQTTEVANTIVYLSAEENQFYLLINDFRTKLGLPQLQIQVALQSSARKHSDWMAAQDFLTHYGPVNNETPFQRMQAEGYSQYYSAGENIACGNGDAAKTFRQWIFSPDHLVNILNPNFHHMGIARAGNGQEHCPYYWTNDFGSQSDPALDPPKITDLSKITGAAESLIGEVSSGEIQLPAPLIAATSTIPAPTASQAYAQCLIPAAAGKGIFNFYTDVDTLLEATSSTSETTIKLTFLKNGVVTPLAPLTIRGASMMKNKSLPLMIIASVPGSRLGGFIVEINTQNGQAQLDAYGNSGGVSSGNGGEISCSVKTL